MPTSFSCPPHGQWDAYFLLFELEKELPGALLWLLAGLTVYLRVCAPKTTSQCLLFQLYSVWAHSTEWCPPLALQMSQSLPFASAVSQRTHCWLRPFLPLPWAPGPLSSSPVSYRCTQDAATSQVCDCQRWRWRWWWQRDLGKSAFLWPLSEAATLQRPELWFWMAVRLGAKCWTLRWESLFLLVTEPRKAFFLYYLGSLVRCLCNLHEVENFHHVLLHLGSFWRLFFR